MINFFKKPKVEFLCTLEAAMYTYPIEPINKSKPKWLEKEAAQFVAEQKLFGVGHIASTIAKCRGIRDLYKTGWVLKAWQDIYVDAKEDGSCEWRTRVNLEKLDGAPEVDFHSADTFRNCPHLKEQIPIIKIQPPWLMKIPKGYNVIQLPMFYDENDLFTTALGIYDSTFGFMELNVQLFWHKRGPHIIKAGTPLAHYILLKDEKIPHEIRLVTDEERKQVGTKQAIIACAFKTNYRSMLTMLKNFGASK